jgi:hypothetical protein
LSIESQPVTSFAGRSRVKATWQLELKTPRELARAIAHSDVAVDFLARAASFPEESRRTTRSGRSCPAPGEFAADAELERRSEFLLSHRDFSA